MSHIRDINPTSFIACPQLKEYNVVANNPYYASIENIKLPQHLEYIGSWVFVKCHMEEIVIPDVVTYIIKEFITYSTKYIYVKSCFLK